MKKLRLGSRLAGGVLAATIAAATAATAAAAQDAPAAAPPADGCSFLGCLLHPRADAAIAQEPARSADAAKVDVEQAGAAEAPRSNKPKAAAPVKPMPAVTVAADGREKPRLKALAAARPQHALRLVAARADDADLTLAPTLDAASGARSLHLYSELLHVVAGPSVATMSDLRDRQVSFGPANGPTAAIARQVFAAAGIAVKETPLDESNALDGLATHDIDAVVVLAPQPSPVLTALRGDGLHLVSWPDNLGAPAGTRPQHLAAASYPSLAKQGADVLAVDAVLTLTPRGERSAAARGLFSSLKQRTGALVRHGFDRLGADLDARKGRRVASADRR